MLHFFECRDSWIHKSSTKPILLIDANRKKSLRRTIFISRAFSLITYILKIFCDSKSKPIINHLWSIVGHKRIAQLDFRSPWRHPSRNSTELRAGRKNIISRAPRRSSVNQEARRFNWSDRKKCSSLAVSPMLHFISRFCSWCNKISLNAFLLHFPPRAIKI